MDPNTSVLVQLLGYLILAGLALILQRGNRQLGTRVVEHLKTEIGPALSEPTARANESAGRAEQAFGMVQAMWGTFQPFMQTQVDLIRDLRSELAQNSQDRRLLENRVMELEDQNKDLKSRIGTYGATVEGLMTDHSNSVADFNVRMTGMSDALTETQRQLEETRQKLALAEERIKSLDDQLRKERVDAKTEKERLTAELADAHLEVEKLRGRVSELEAEVERLKTSKPAEPPTPSSSPSTEGAPA